MEKSVEKLMMVILINNNYFEIVSDLFLYIALKENKRFG